MLTNWSSPRGRPVRSWALDILIAVLIVAVSAGSGNPPQAALVLAAGLCLVFRRVWPVPANLLAFALCVASLGGHNLGLALGGSVVVLHTLTVLGRVRIATVVLALTEVWVVVMSVAVVNTDAADRFTTTVYLLVGLSTPFVLSFVLGLYRRTRDQYQAGLQARNRSLEVEREQRDLLAAADERARIAREMHDLIAHHLTVVVALSEGLARSGEITSDRSRQAVTTTVAMAREALAETRRLLGAIPREDGDSRHPVPNLRSLDGLVGQVRATGLPVTFEVDGTPPDDDAVPGGLQLTVYRLVQEALTNTMKHAHDVTRTVVRLRYGPDHLRVSIEDDGEGGPSDGLGRGILGMRERVQSFDGTLHVGPGPAGGWKVSAGFPIPTKNKVAQ